MLSSLCAHFSGIARDARERDAREREREREAVMVTNSNDKYEGETRFENVRIFPRRSLRTQVCRCC